MNIKSEKKLFCLVKFTNQGFELIPCDESDGEGFAQFQSFLIDTDEETQYGITFFFIDKPAGPQPVMEALYLNRYLGQLVEAHRLGLWLPGVNMQFKEG